MSLVRLVGAVPVLALVFAFPAPASAVAAPTPADLCAQTQFDLGVIDPTAFASAGLSIVDETFSSFDDFVLSKSGVDPATGQILTTTYVEADPADPTVVKQFRCKARTGESLNQGAWPDGSINNSPGFERPPFLGFGDVADGVSGGRGTCETVNARTIDEVWSALTPEEQAASAFRPDDGTFVTAPDDEALFGPVWTAPFEPLVIADGVLTVRSKSLYAPTTDQSGIGPRFLGAHYCTLVGAEYLARVVAENSAPIPSPSPSPSTPVPTPSATVTASPSTTPAPSAPQSPESTPATADTATSDAGSGATLPATGGISGGSALLGALVMSMGVLMVARARAGRWLPAGTGRHRARH